MKNKLKDVLSYIVKNYPYSDDLTKTRTTKLVYLVDWEYTKKYGHQLNGFLIIMVLMYQMYWMKLIKIEQ